MPNDNSTMESRFDEKYDINIPQEEIDVAYLREDSNRMKIATVKTVYAEDIKSFIKSEISRAVGEREREIVGMIRKYSPTCGGGKCYVVEEILEKLTNQS